MKRLLESFTVEHFIEVLPEATRDAAVQVAAVDGDLGTFALQLALEPGSGLATKGGSLWPSDIMPRLVTELRSVICTDDERYGRLRERLRTEGTTSARVVVSLVSSAVAVNVHVAVALCVPFVALLLAVIVKAGAEAWCRTFDTDSLGNLPPGQNTGLGELPPK